MTATNDDARAVREQQHTGNHDKPGPEKDGADKHGGTRHGAENVEPAAAGGKPGFHKVDETAQREAAEERREDKGYD